MFQVKMRLIKAFFTLFVFALAKGDTSDATLDLYRDQITFSTEVDKRFTVNIVARNMFDQTLSCNLVDPHNVVYDKSTIDSSYNVVFQDQDTSLTLLLYPCEATFSPVTANMNGNWNLIGNMMTSDGEHFEIVQPFNVIVAGVAGEEESKEPGDEIELHETDSEESSESDQEEQTTPEFTQNQTEAPNDFLQLEDMTFTLGQQIETEFGPDDSDLCEVLDPKKIQVYRGFGRCKMIREQVTADCEGEWAANVVLSGKMLVTTYKFQVHVVEPEETVVHTAVNSSADGLKLSCSVLRDMPLNNCKFIRPDNELVFVKEGVSEGRYSYHKDDITSQEGIHCGLHIREPEESDYGTWQCVMETEERRHSTFLRVDKEGSPIDTSLVAVAENSVIVTVAGNSVNLKCNVQTTIEYCWFRAPNGTAFSVSPNTTSETVEYSGNGFDFGECNMRIKAASTSDNGAWRCNSGIPNSVDATATINLSVYSTPLVMSAGIRQLGRTQQLTVSGRTYDGTPVNYCRFITPHGVGINSNTTMSRYSTVASRLEAGICTVTVINPSYAELSPWAIAAKLVGSNDEVLSRVVLVRSTSTQGKVFFFFYWILILALIIVLIAIMVGSNKRARTWTRRQATTATNAVRNSFRRKNTATSEETNERPPAYQP